MFPLKDNLPTDRFPLVTVALIVVNVLMYLFFQEAVNSGYFNYPDDQNVVDYGAIPYEITHPREGCVPVDGSQALQCGPSAAGQVPTWLTALSSMFMHGSLLHLAGNMLFLWIFGNNIEDSMGRLKFVLFYVLGGLAAIAAQVLVGTDSKVPTIGASGAVAAVLGGYLLLFPRAKVLTLFFLIVVFFLRELPALLFLGLWFVQQALFGYFELTGPRGDDGGVAYFAHIGGFVFGLLAVKLLARRHRRRGGPYELALGRQ